MADRKYDPPRIEKRTEIAPTLIGIVHFNSNEPL
jgi:hypothetical protein